MSAARVGRLSGAYDPHSVEEWTRNYWKEIDVYSLVKGAERGARHSFNFVDGPPYPSSDIPHIGTAWNKVLKDVILRYKRARGFRVFDRPGFDCHGLPIEVAVEKSQGIRNKKDIEQVIGVANFINACRRLALENSKSMTKWFEELGVLMDWRNPYYTLVDEYVEAAWTLIKRAHERGLLALEQRVVYWCPRCQTTLAEYEVEYKDLEDPSIYVKFRLPAIGAYAIAWTTTPWTLIANTFLMINPDEEYVEVAVNGERWIVARRSLDRVAKELGMTKYDVVRTFIGAELVGMAYEHPLEALVPLQAKLKKYHKIVGAARYVNVEEGTGIVHGAPAHGFEDFEVAQQEGISEVLNPVNEDGTFNEEAGKYAGLYVREANELIINDLERAGALAGRGKLLHKYPVCWRCKTPVIMRSTQQWVIKVSKLREKLIEEAKSVRWIPSWGLARMLSILENVKDWVVSRQRYWGVPLPIWRCSRGHVVVVGSRRELRELAGTDPPELHRPWIDEVKFKCPICGEQMVRVPDVADVWLDSGIAFYAARTAEAARDEPLDLVVEGHDQIRGWFFSLLKSGVILNDRAPYRTVLIHGFMLDELGREMHKSLGNYVGLDEAIRKVGRDPLRLWLASNTVWEDARFSWRSLEEARRDLSIAWNVFVFASSYMNLDGYDPRSQGLSSVAPHLGPEDRWILSRTNKLVREFEKAMESFDVATATRILRSFIVEDVSHWYIRMIRSKVWVEENTPQKIASYAALYRALLTWLRLASLVVPHFAEYVYQIVFREVEGAPSVHLLPWPGTLEGHDEPELEKDMEVLRMIYEAAASARMKAGLKLRQPLRKLMVFTDKEEVGRAIERLADLVKIACNVKEVEVRGLEEVRKLVSYVAEPVAKSIGPKFRARAREVIEYIARNNALVADDVIRQGYHEAVLDGEKIRITAEDVSVKPVTAPGYVIESLEWGGIALDTALSEEERAEGLAREIVRRIQVMRKQMGLDFNDFVEVVVAPPRELIPLVERVADYIARETRSVSVSVVSTFEKGEEHYGAEWDIDGETFNIYLRKVARGG
ncbi:MAG: isoleucine--tRNA ligase [Desulfurococcaceae archaeon]